MAMVREFAPETPLRPTGNPEDDENSLAGLLTDLSRMPELLHQLLDPVRDGAETAERVLELRRLADPAATQTPGIFDFYLVPRGPVVMPRTMLHDLVRRHYLGTAELMSAIGETELARRLAADVPILPGEAPDPAAPFADRVDDLEADLDEALTDTLIHVRTTSDHPLFALDEAAYTLAASYELQRHVLWPAYRATIGVQDPYRAWAGLWAAGTCCRHRGDTIIYWP